MSQDVVNVLKFVVDDDTAAGFSSANRNLKKNERAIQRVIEQQKKLTREAGKSADQIAIETLKRADAKNEVIAQVMALQKERQAIMDAKSARTESINEVDKMIAAMKEQAATIGMSSSELAIHKAVQKGATAEQLAAIQATQAEITAKRNLAGATTQTVSTADQMIQKLRQEIDLFGKSDDQILAYKLALDGATQAQIDEVMALRSKMTAMNKSLPLMQRMKQQLRFMRGGFGQVGHQVQDVAVQLQTGTDAMIVFGQQGSQIVSLFGPGGAMLGALFAVGAAIGSSLTAMSREAGKELDDLVEKITEQRRELGLLTAAELANQAAMDTEVREQAQEQIEDHEKKVGMLASQLALATSTLAKFEDGTIDAEKAERLFGLTHEKQIAKVAELTQEHDKAAGTLNGLKAVVDPATQSLIEQARATKDNKEAVINLIAGLVSEAEQLGKTARQQAIYNARLKGATPEQIKQIKLIYDTIEAHNKEQAALRIADAEKKRRQREAASQAAAEQRRLQALLGGLQDFIDGREGVLARQYVKESTMLQNATLEEIKSEENRNAMLLALRKKFAADIAALRGKGAGSDEEDALLQEGQRIIDQMKDFGKSEADILQERAANKIAVLEALGKREAELEAITAATIKNIRAQLALDLDEIQEQAHQKQMERAQKELDKQFEIIGGYETLETAASDALFSVFSHAQDADDALKGLAKTLVDEAIKGIIRMGMEQIKNALIADMITKTAMTQAVATQTAAGAAIAAAMAPAALATSLATAGANAAGASAGIAATGAALKASMLATSFEGGGFTGRGARSGGVDGRGGFAAILHPNETVIDHEGGGMAPVVVNQTINVTTGVQQTVRAEIANLMPQISDAAKSAVAEGRMRGGSYGSAMGV